MCHRITPLLRPELEQALDSLERTGRARVPPRDPATILPDAYPGTQVPLFVWDDDGRLRVAERIWGFEAQVGGRSKRVFNTRMETALAQARSGRGLWAGPISAGRCLVPVRSFYEPWRRAGKDVRFSYPGRRVFLLAGVCDDERFSVVTCEPNADVAPFHTRMPVVLGPTESAVWRGADFARLADRSNMRLSVTEA
ncbi:MAG: SOS response-associated peptidase family protein [Coriobacteriales bacterium]|nr:SOS response-associated peptidase family protein [Coriobacteriales bacterium]